ncbi:MAG TPA: SpoIIE family protein phosphatase, partial [Thermoanaerobaculia bacterium]
TKFRAEMQRAQTELDARRKRQRDRRAARERRTTTTPATAKVVSAVPVTPSARPAPRPVVRPKSDLSPAERKSLAVKERKATLVLGREFNVPVEKQGEIVGQIRAQLNPAEVIRRVLGGQGGDRDEVPFAIDREGNIYTRNETERTTLNQLGITQRIKEGRSLRDIQGWIVVSSRDEESGLRVGVARPVGQNLIQLRRTAARNFGWGVGLIAFALIGIVPLANHFTRDVKRVTQGAERIAQGDLQTRLPVKGNDEFGQLALAFNRMAEDLSENQRRLLSEESARREQEMKQKLLSLEYERKSVELEDARRFQLSMLPKELPRHDAFDVAVFTQTATEVGGDYYDFHTDGNGPLSVTIGDATGHGARAGTMVTVIKALFAGYDGASPANFLSNAAEKIKRMELGRMAMALAVARFERSRVTFASAGMPPMFIHRANENRVEEVAIRATPLGTLGTSYDECSIDLHRGDTVLLMTDGFPELLNSGGQQLGYPQAMADFGEAAVASSDSNEVIAALSATVRRWHGDLPPNDDITFVVVRATA